jgi:hypothetical protein
MYTWCICLCAVYAVSCVIQNMKITQVSRRNMQNKVLCMGITLPKGVRTKGLTAQSANSPDKQGGVVCLKIRSPKHIQIPDHFPVQITTILGYPPLWGKARWVQNNTISGWSPGCLLSAIVWGAWKSIRTKWAMGDFTFMDCDIPHYPSVN